MSKRNERRMISFLFCILYFIDVSTQSLRVNIRRWLVKKQNNIFAM